jgi:diguanylate cyclase (GGDEF)-like protein
MRKGISIRILNFISGFLFIVFSVLLIMATYRSSSQYTEMKENTDDLIMLQQAAYDLQTGSDILTEQVLYFAETVDVRYLKAYFTEAKETRRRDNALAELQASQGKTTAYEELSKAMSQSVHLMNREYYSMRLTAEAYGHDLSTLPEEVQNVVLAEGDAALDPTEKEKKARSLIFDNVYRGEKDQISEHMQNCLNNLNEDIRGKQIAATDQMKVLLDREKLLIIGMIISSLLSMNATLVLVVRPLLKAVGYINNEEDLPEKGSREFRFLARSYNTMFHSHVERNKQLSYEASHDSLTGLYNRSGYEYLIRQIDPSTSAILVFDIDSFKAFNDEYGHKAGDRVLCIVAKEIQRSFRSQDHICRVGGDEYIVILEQIGDTAEDMIRDKVLRINQRLSALRNNLPPIRVSCGAAIGTQFSDVDTMINMADNALYEAKARGGRDVEISH